MKKWLSLSLILVICLSAATALARYSYTSIIAAGFALSGNTAICEGSVSPSDLSTQTIVSVKLQQKNGDIWKTLKTWTASTSDGSSATAGGTLTVARGEYRVYVTGTIKDTDGNVLETTYKASATKTY